ncbi:adenylate kinase family enzyme [Litoreibacter ponti]|uniref:Adenylate kinase family enzyme n=1 Tax=Litoreibacter ponti TaxID=1510457 RepID=A0A2T6BMX0_9RHOB|nr:AAA family ATPase [Litoreibacter ponti]PTX57411.1 adenylate kinase family enzyme [Litoreibacter ponti]
MPMYVSIPQAAAVLRTAKRVLVVGCSGGGKSTLSLKISERFDLEYLSYDRDVRWLPGWQVRDREEQRQIITQLVRKDRWVMDGTTVSTFDLRLPRADLLVWVRVPRRVALSGIARRVFRNYGRVRIDMAEGCPEQLPDREFLNFIWTFEKRVAPRIVGGIDRFGPNLPVVTLRSRSEFAALVDG